MNYILGYMTHVLSLIAVAIVYLLARVCVYKIHDVSMYPTIKPGSWVIVNPWAYVWAAPQVGDIIIIAHPSYKHELVKRLVRTSKGGLGDFYWVEGDNGDFSVDSRKFGNIFRPWLRGKVVWWAKGKR